MLKDGEERSSKLPAMDEERAGQGLRPLTHLTIMVGKKKVRFKVVPVESTSQGHSIGGLPS